VGINVLVFLEDNYRFWDFPNFEIPDNDFLIVSPQGVWYTLDINPRIAESKLCKAYR